VKKLRLGILGSGKGSNSRAILEAIRRGQLPNAEAVVVISDVLQAPILDIAREFSVPNAFLPPGHFRTRLEPEAEVELVRMLRDAGVDLVVLAGFMRVLKEPMLRAFSRRIINIHPALLPKFPGLEAWAQALAAGERVTGCTVHYVDAQIDHGDIIAQQEVPILPNDTAGSLHARIQAAEHELYPKIVAQLAATLTPLKSVPASDPD
jgi:phosphoribosylglycinamide formyltransferase 1